MGRVAGPWAQILDTDEPAFALNGEEFYLPPRTAGEWLRALALDDLDAIVPDMLDPEDLQRWGDLYLGTDAFGNQLVTQELHERIVNQLITEAAGMPWTAALGLLGWAGNNWRAFDGWCVAHHLDPLAMPLDRLCNAIYSRHLSGQKDEAARIRFDSELFAPPPDADPAKPETMPAEWSAEGQASSFDAAMSQFSAVGMKNRRVGPDAPVR